MAAAPNFASVGHNGLAQIAVGDTTTAKDLITGVAAGTRVKEIRVYSGPTTAPGAVVFIIQITDGVTTNTIEVLTLTNTANLQQAVFSYSNLILPSTSWKLQVAVRTTVTSGGTVHVTAEGEDLT